MGVLNCTSYYKAISNEERKACFNNIYIYVLYIHTHRSSCFVGIIPYMSVPRYSSCYKDDDRKR